MVFPNFVFILTTPNFDEEIQKSDKRIRKGETAWIS